MRKFLTLALILGAATTIGSVAGAEDGIPMEEATAAGVVYDMAGNSTMVTIVGDPGAPFVVYDATGTQVAAGALDDGTVSFMVGDAGPGPDGTILFVVVNEEVVAATDPFWEWD